jgi:eukaryotic-like serine/threonine-protein kinase
VGSQRLLGASPAGSAQLQEEIVCDLLRTRLLTPSTQSGILGEIEGYGLVRLLGAGGMGVVFLAQASKAVPALESSQLVALKLLKPVYLAKPAFQARFTHEAERQSNLSHPNLLPVLARSPHRSFTVDSLYKHGDSALPRCPVLRTPPSFFVTPYIAEGSLEDLLGRTGPFSLPGFMKIALQLGAALSYLHAQGFVHRDVKPANVLIDARGHVYVADLGLATSVAETAVFEGHARCRAGTAAYLSPVVAAGGAEDTRSDIYAFGSVCYAMLAGHPPYTGISPQEVLSFVLAGPPQCLSEIVSHAPAALIQIVEGAMARQVRHRYASMDDILADLHAFGRGLGVDDGGAPAPFS